jgi:hypothetical protein
VEPSERAPQRVRARGEIEQRLVFPGRIMITFNVKDFPRIAVEWAAAERHHAGCLIVVGIDHSELGLVLRVIDAALTARPDQAAWQDYTAWGTRRSAP